MYNDDLDDSCGYCSCKWKAVPFFKGGPPVEVKHSCPNLKTTSTDVCHWFYCYKSDTSNIFGGPWPR